VHRTSRLPRPSLFRDLPIFSVTFQTTLINRSDTTTLVHIMLKVILITGCSSGFGQEMALAALAHGDTVVATARDPTKLGDLASRGAITERLDVGDSDAALQSTVKRIIAKTGTIDILINNV
jgi:NADP-dependent 3-hydroxy acid dehydrogenase YdfG